MLPESRFLSITSDGKGVSQAITTVILVMAVMSVSLAAFFFTQLNLTMQSEQAEFENAKEAMVNLARIIENLEEGDAHYVTFSMNSGGLELRKGVENIRLLVWDDERSVEWDLGKVNLIKLRSGSGVSGSSFRVLEGDVRINNKDDLLDRYIMIRPDNPGPMGVVYQEWDKGAWVVIDFGRIRVMPTGTIPRTDDGLTWYRVNTVDIVYVNITFGEIGGGGTFNVYARVKDVKKYAPETFYSQIITVKVERGPDNAPTLYNDEYDVPGFSGASITMVYLTVVNVEVSVR